MKYAGLVALFSTLAIAACGSVTALVVTGQMEAPAPSPRRTGGAMTMPVAMPDSTQSQANSSGIRVRSSHSSIEMTLPQTHSDGRSEQEICDEAKRQGYSGVALNSDGSVVYTMTYEKYTSLCRQAQAKALDKLTRLAKDLYSVRRITYSKDFSRVTLTVNRDAFMNSADRITAEMGVQKALETLDMYRQGECDHLVRILDSRNGELFGVLGDDGAQYIEGSIAVGSTASGQSAAEDMTNQPEAAPAPEKASEPEPLPNATPAPQLPLETPEPKATPDTVSKRIGSAIALGGFQITLTKAQFAGTIKDALFIFEPGDGNTYLALSLNVKNLGTTAADFLRSSRVESELDCNVTYDGQYSYSPSTLIGYSSDLHDTRLNPLTSKTGLVVFKLPIECVEEKKSIELTFTCGGQSQSFKVR